MKSPIHRCINSSGRLSSSLQRFFVPPLLALDIDHPIPFPGLWNSRDHQPPVFDFVVLTLIFPRLGMKVSEEHFETLVGGLEDSRKSLCRYRCSLRCHRQPRFPYHPPTFVVQFPYPGSNPLLSCALFIHELSICSLCCSIGWHEYIDTFNTDSRLRPRDSISSLSGDFPLLSCVPTFSDVFLVVFASSVIGTPVYLFDAFAALPKSSDHVLVSFSHHTAI
ncbi:hypothetical protein V8B97DRAFT_1295577 [Scleroderma yunnanense]